MALKMVKGSIDRMFDKNLQDLVRGIRNHKEDERLGLVTAPVPAPGPAHWACSVPLWAPALPAPGLGRRPPPRTPASVYPRGGEGEALLEM
ncbi:hypothetical protein P7K49_032846 [Saguinus oedipus]|uniref:Uncharacterized protein n=1 Tax=Saguinus oedipus TaxID=9490 RepID=A0ABQ9TQ80_SAGOE|nr:hypothetical protein P7K49_032846 [Saguinus oedipus]